eukprot:g19090.t1
MPRKIIIDTDPGQDDAVAILLALASPEEIEVLGITAVAGNVPLELTAKNARIICELAGKLDVKVYAGCDRPMAKTLVTAEHVHGQTGLNGPKLPDPVMALQDGHGVDFIIDTLRAEPAGTVTLCPLGPLTNIATAFERAPDIIEKVQEIVLMGGAYFEVGNITPAAEFNIYVDPEAAEITFRSGVPIVVMPLDVTHKALVTPARNDAFRALGTPVGTAVAEMTDFFERFDKEKYGSEGAPLHDPCVTAYLIRPELFSGRHINVEIEVKSDLTRGMSVADWWGAGPPVTALHLAGPEDLPRLLPLVAAFHEEFGLPLDDDHRVQALAPLLDGSPYGAVWLMGPSRAPIGYIILTFGWSVEFGGMDGFVDELYVRPAVRRRGIATEVLEQLPKTLAETGLCALHLEVREDDEQTVKMYRRQLFKPREGYMLMTKKI